MVNPGGESGHSKQGQDTQSVGSQVRISRALCKYLQKSTYNNVHSRSSSGPEQETASHAGIKNSNVVWVCEGRALTSGLGSDRARELVIRDTRNISRPQKVLSLDVSSGIFVP